MARKKPNDFPDQGQICSRYNCLQDSYGVHHRWNTGLEVLLLSVNKQTLHRFEGWYII